MDYYFEELESCLLNERVKDSFDELCVNKKKYRLPNIINRVCLEKTKVTINVDDIFTFYCYCGILSQKVVNLIIEYLSNNKIETDLHYSVENEVLELRLINGIKINIFHDKTNYVNLFYVESNLFVDFYKFVEFFHSMIVFINKENPYLIFNKDNKYYNFNNEKLRIFL